MNRALDLAQLRGAQYADIRVVNNLTEAITVRNGIIEAFNLAETIGLGCACWWMAPGGSPPAGI